MNDDRVVFDEVEESHEVTPHYGMFDSDIKAMILSIYKGEPASKHAIKAELILNSCTDLPTEHVIALQKIIDGRIYVDIIEFYKDAGFKAPKRIRNNYKHHSRY